MDDGQIVPLNTYSRGLLRQEDAEDARTYLGAASETYVDDAVSGLASTSYVDSEISDAVSGLASVTYVDNGLALKANLAGWTASRTMVTDGSGNLTVSSLASSKLTYLDIATPGTLEASKVPVVDANKDIRDFRNVGLVAMHVNQDVWLSRKAAGHFRAGTTSTGEDAAFTFGVLVTTLNQPHILRGDVAIGKATNPTSTLDVNGAIRGNAMFSAIDGTVGGVAFRLNNNGTGMYRPSSNVVGFAAGGVDSGRFDDNATAGNTRLLVYDINAGAMQRVKTGANGTGPSGTGRALYLDNI